MAEPTTQEHIRWALMALHLARNKLNAIGVDENDTAMVNLAAAENTLRSIDGVASLFSGRAVAAWKKAAANMIAHWKKNGPTVEAQWCTHAAQLLSMGGELMPDDVLVAPPSATIEEVGDAIADMHAGGVQAVPPTKDGGVTR